MQTLTLEIASRIVDATLKAGRDAGLKPLTVVVLDSGGHDVVLKREDGSGILRADIARGKAWGALGLGMGSRELGRRAEQNPRFFAALAAASGGRVIPNPGGVLIKDASGALLGAVGVSGDTAERDEGSAVAAINAAGLVADPG
ncbi:MAG TPA: heme-binding protein [Casimicrobiaceae bacterium]|nr:heme-binding protein [Casimicrobiaceae bacterium]